MRRAIVPAALACLGALLATCGPSTPPSADTPEARAKPTPEAETPLRPDDVMRGAKPTETVGRAPTVVERRLQRILAMAEDPDADLVRRLCEEVVILEPGNWWAPELRDEAARAHSSPEEHDAAFRKMMVRLPAAFKALEEGLARAIAAPKPDMPSAALVDYLRETSGLNLVVSNDPLPPSGLVFAEDPTTARAVLEEIGRRCSVRFHPSGVILIDRAR